MQRGERIVERGPVDERPVRVRRAEHVEVERQCAEAGGVQAGDERGERITEWVLGVWGGAEHEVQASYAGEYPCIE